MIRPALIATCTALAFLAACSGMESDSPSGATSTASAAGPARVGDTAIGKVLTDSRGMTLYTFDRDATGKSNCNGQCVTAWPPLMASADSRASGDWSVVTRDDGSKMWAYKGKPLYTWQRDTKAGDTTGEGVNNVWRIARP